MGVQFYQSYYTVVLGYGICPLSGFTRRLFLQVLLEDERILIAIPQQYRVQTPISVNQIQHPSFGAGRKFRTMLVNMHISVGELTGKISGKRKHIFFKIRAQLFKASLA